MITDAKNIAVATVSQMLGRSIAFAIPFLLLNVYSPGKATDGFFLALAIGFFFYGTLANALTDTVVARATQGLPVLSASRRILLGLILAVPAGGIVLLATQHLPSGLAMALGTAVMVLAGLHAAFSSALLSAAHRFAAPGLLWGLRAAPLVLWWLARPDLSLLGWLVVMLALADSGRALLLLQHGKRRGVAQRDGGWRTLQSSAVVVAGSVISGVNPIVDRFIASLHGPGGISLLEAGERMYGVLATLVTIGVMNVVLVRLSAERTPERFRRLLARIGTGVVCWAAVWSVTAAVAWLALGDWLVGSLIRGDSEQRTTVTLVFLAYLAGLPVFALSLVCVRAYLAQGWHRSIFFLAIVSLTANLALSLGLFVVIGLPGIAAATTIVYCLTTALMCRQLLTSPRPAARLDIARPSP